MTDKRVTKKAGRVGDDKASRKSDDKPTLDPLVVHGGREGLDETAEPGDPSAGLPNDPNEPVSLDDSAILSMGDTESLDSIDDLPFPDRTSLDDSGELAATAITVQDTPARTVATTGDQVGSETLEEDSASFVYEMSLEISFDPEDEEESLQEEASVGSLEYSPPLDLPPDKAHHREVLSKTIVHNMGRHLRRLGMPNRRFREMKSTYYRERDRTDVASTYFCSRKEPFLVSVALRYRGSFLSAVDVRAVFECPRTSPDLGVPPGTTDYFSVRRPDGMYAQYYGYSPEIRGLGQHTGVGSFVQRGITQFVVDCYSFAMAQGMDFGWLGEATIADPKYRLGDPHTPMVQLADFARVVADT